MVGARVNLKFPDVFTVEKFLSDPARLERIVARRILSQRRCCLLCNGRVLLHDRERRLRCSTCGHRIFVKRLTPMASSHHPIAVWVMAIWLICGSNSGLNQHELARFLGVSRQAMMSLYGKLRALMAEHNQAISLGGPDLSVALYDSHVTFVRGNAVSPKRPRSIVVAADGVQIAAWMVRRHGYSETGRFVDRWISSGSIVQCLEISRYTTIRRRGLRFVAQDWESAEMARAFAATCRICSHIPRTFQAVDIDRLEAYIAERVFFENMKSPADAFWHLVRQLASIRPQSK